MPDTPNVLAARNAVFEVGKARMNLRIALANLSLGELAEVITEVHAYSPVVINIDSQIYKKKGGLAILKPCEDLNLGIVLWSAPKLTMMASWETVPDSICVDFMRNKVFFEVFSGGKGKSMDKKFACIAEACKRNGIRNIFLLNPGNMCQFFRNTGNCDIEVTGVDDFLDILSMHVDLGDLKLSFLDFQKSTALEFHEYMRKCGIRDDLGV